MSNLLLRIEYLDHYDALIITNTKLKTMLSRSEGDNFIVEGFDENSQPSQLIFSSFYKNLKFERLTYSEWEVVPSAEVPAPLFYLQEIENICIAFFNDNNINIVEELRICLSSNSV